MQKELNERQLVNQVLNGDSNAFIRLIRQYEGLVLHIVTPLIGVNEDREDICQDIFIKVYQGLYGFQFNSKLGTWIGNIAYNTSINFLQKKKNVLLSDLIPPEAELQFYEKTIAGHPDPEQIAIKEDEFAMLHTAIEQLPKLQKTVLLLFYMDEMSLDEVAKVMEMPVNTIKSHLFRARNSLKLLMSKNKAI